MSQLTDLIRDFPTFASTLAPLWGSKPFGKIHHQMAEFLDRPDNRKLILAFRGSHKSTILQEYILYRILRDLNISILRASSTKPLSDSFVLELKHLMEAVPFLKPLVSKELWRSDEFTVNHRTVYSKDATLLSGSLGTNVVGRHPRLIIVDDPVDLDNSRTDGQRMKVSEWLRSLESLAGPDGEIIVIGTRWHREDVYDHLLTNSTYKSLVIPIEFHGQPTWPEVHTTSYLADLRKNQGPLMYSMQYLLDPAPAELATFKPIVYTEDPTVISKKVYIDWAWGAEGDYAVAIVAGTRQGSSGKELILLDSIMSNRHSPENLVRQINDLAASYQATSIKIDPTALGELSQTYPSQVSRWSTMSNWTDKEGRIMAMQTDWQRDRVMVYAPNASHFRHLDQERYDWDFARQYDDALDTVAYAWRDLLR